MGASPQQYSDLILCRTFDAELGVAQDEGEDADQAGVGEAEEAALTQQRLRALGSQASGMADEPAGLPGHSPRVVIVVLDRRLPLNTQRKQSQRRHRQAAG